MTKEAKSLVEQAAGKEVAVIQPTINLPAIINREELWEAMEANLQEGIQLKYDIIKVPGGGVLAFSVINEAGQEDTAKEVKGVILDYYFFKARWGKKYTGENNPPDCLAIDGKTGEPHPEGDMKSGGDCKSCPYNEFTPDPVDGIKRKQCKDLYRAFLSIEGKARPIKLAIPPTSRKAFEDYLNRLVDIPKPMYGVVTRITLSKEKSKGGIDYSQLVFGYTDKLQREEMREIKKFADDIRPYLRAIPIDQHDYDSSPEPDSAPAEGSTQDGWG